MTTDLGGKSFAKGIILGWLVNTGGSNLKLLETATGLPGKLLSPLLAEMMLERTVRLNRVVFRMEKEGYTANMDRVKIHRSHILAKRASQRGWTRRLPRWLRHLVNAKKGLG